MASNYCVRNIRLVLRRIRNLVFDLQYGRFVGGTVSTVKPGYHDVVSTDYGMMKQIFRNRIMPSDVLVDVGCGKGRVINWWLSQRLHNKIVGLEYMEEIAEQTRHRLRKYPNVQIITGDATENLPSDATLLYCANPFDRNVWQRFKVKLREHCATNANVRILYYACVDVDLFKEDPEWSVEEIRLTKPWLADDSPPTRWRGGFAERHTRLAVIKYIGPRNS